MPAKECQMPENEALTSSLLAQQAFNRLPDKLPFSFAGLIHESHDSVLTIVFMRCILCGY